MSSWRDKEEPRLRPLARPNVISIDRGRLLDARDVAALVFRARVNASWVERYVAPIRRVWWGRRCYWYEQDARDWYREYELSSHTSAEGVGP